MRKQGSGTFVRSRPTPGVLVVDDDPQMRRLVATHVADVGFRCLEADGPAAAYAATARSGWS